jgi:hypothetical protein
MANNDFLLTPKFTMCFPSLFKAEDPFNNGRPKFSVMAVFDPSAFTDAEKELWAAILLRVDEECVSVHKKRADALKRSSTFKAGIRDAGEKEQLGPPFVEGNLMANLTTTMPPGVCDWTRQPVAEGSALVYGGARARCKVSVYAFDNVSKGYALGLCNLQVLPGGKRVDGRVSAADEFDAEEYDEELADLPELVEDGDPGPGDGEMYR